MVGYRHSCTLAKNYTRIRAVLKTLQSAPGSFTGFHKITVRTSTPCNPGLHTTWDSNTFRYLFPYGVRLTEATDVLFQVLFSSMSCWCYLQDFTSVRCDVCCRKTGADVVFVLLKCHNGALLLWHLQNLMTDLVVDFSFSWGSFSKSDCGNPQKPTLFNYLVSKCSLRCLPLFLPATVNGDGVLGRPNWAEHTHIHSCPISNWLESTHVLYHTLCLVFSNQLVKQSKPHWLSAFK